MVIFGINVYWVQIAFFLFANWDLYCVVITHLSRLILLLDTAVAIAITVRFLQFVIGYSGLSVTQFLSWDLS